MNVKKIINLRKSLAVPAGLMGQALLLAINAEAANWYVRPNSSGNNTGSDWNDAWSFSSINWSSVAAGDTVWLAGGTYSSQLVINANGTPGNPVHIYRVRSTDTAPVASAGWNPSFDSQVVINCQTFPQLWIKGPNNDITIDGRIMSGILLQGPTAGGDNCRVADRGNVSDIFVSHVHHRADWLYPGLCHLRDCSQ
ncbi:MAG: hypothetical protein JO170_25770 [Verrucomicrobia bacterium]|nr:hypothetical protein [Verrucomicrobiota bacterium]